MKNTDCEILEMCERIEFLIEDLKKDIKDLKSTIIDIEKNEESKTCDVL